MKSFFDKQFKRLFEVILRFPFHIIGIFVIFTVFLIYYLPTIQIFTDMKSFVPRDQVFWDDQEIKETFNIKEFVIMVLSAEKSVFTEPTLRYVAEIIGEIENIEGVYTIRSIFSEDNIKNTFSGLVISPFLGEEQLDTFHITQTVEDIQQFTAIQGMLVSHDLQNIAILIEIEDGANKATICRKINAILSENSPPTGQNVHLSGMPVFEGVLGDNIVKDLMVMIPIVSVAVLLILFLAYRSWLLVVVSSIEILVVDIWTVGLMAFLDVPFYTIHAIMPVILMALAVADEIHVFSRYLEEPESGERRSKILRTMQDMWNPVVLTSLTTAIGFLSFLSTTMPPLKYFGVFTAVGVLGAMVFSLIITPIAILLNPFKESTNRNGTQMRKPLVTFGSFIGRHPKALLLLLICLFALSIVGASKIFIQDAWLYNFSKNSKAYLDTQAINSRFNGTRMIFIEFDTGAIDGIKDTVFLQKLKDFQVRIEKNEFVGGTFSFADIMEKMNFEMNDKYTVPHSSDAIAQYLFLLEGRSYDYLWDFDYRKVRLIIFCTKGDYLTGHSVLSDVKKHIQMFPQNITIKYGGDFILGYHWLSLLGTDQVKSLSTALPLILLAATIFFGSFRKGFIVTSPILLAVGINFAVMGFGSIPLAVATSMFSSINLGVGIDYAIHFQSRFDLLRHKMSISQAIRDIFATAGEAIFWDGCIIIAGFMTLLFSQMPPNRTLGFVVSLGVASSVVATFFLIPTLLILSTKTSSHESTQQV